MAYRTWATGETITASLLNAQSPTLCTSATRPTGGNLYEGVLITETDTDRILYYDGTGWIIMAEPVQSYTPTLTNATLGNGTITGTSHRSDGYCDVSVTFALGSTSTVGTDPAIGLPYAAAAFGIGAFNVGFLDLSPVTRYNGTNVAAGAGSTSVTLLGLKSDLTWSYAGSITATTPITWTTGDAIYMSGRYQMNTRYL